MSALAKPGKSKRKPESAAETLDQLESLGDRLGSWIAENAMLLVGLAVLILLMAGGYGLVNSRRVAAREAASSALAKVENSFISAMGSPPDAFVIEEPANPETGRRVREEYVGRYGEVASEFSGTLEGGLAALQSGSLQQILGRTDEAIATWQAALATSPEQSVVRGLLLERIAGSHETLGRWAEAAAAHEAAAAITNFPVRYLALAEGARCYAEAGESAKALALFDRLQAEAPQLQIAPHIVARLTELRAVQVRLQPPG